MYKVRVYYVDHMERSGWLPFHDAAHLAVSMRGKPGVEDVELVCGQECYNTMKAMTIQEHKDLHNWRER